MKFKVHLTKITNFFYFLANLSEWASWSRKEYNQEWIRLTGKLTIDEKKMLKQFRQVLKQTSKKEPLLYILFFQLNKRLIWPNIKKGVCYQDYIVIKKTFKIFQKRFNKTWNDSIAKKIKNKFKRYINNFNYTNSILQDLASFYSKPIDQRNVNIFLILLPSKIKTGGGRYDLKNQAVILERSPLQLISLRTIEIFFHELIHLYFEQPLLEKLSNIYFKKSSIRYCIREIIAGALLPDGYLSQKYFKKNTLSKFRKLSPIQKLSLKSIPLIKDYLDHNKKVDKNLIKKIGKLCLTRF